MSMGKNRWEHGIYDARDMPALIAERDALVEQLKGMATQLDKYKEIAEENNGEHVKLETLREDLRSLERDWRDAARRSNQPDSPSIWVDCADELLRVMR